MRVLFGLDGKVKKKMKMCVCMCILICIYSSNVLASLSGILSLGFGDAAASLIGKRYGRWHWPGTKKTVEGTIAFIIAVFLSSSMIVYSAALIGVDDATRFAASAGPTEWLNYSFVITLTGKKYLVDSLFFIVFTHLF